MARWYVKCSPIYQGPFDLAPEHVLSAMRRHKTARKKPTSVALDERTLQELKAVSDQQSISYQALIRVFILRGIERA
jgi:hypothetical protein